MTRYPLWWIWKLTNWMIWNRRWQRSWINRLNWWADRYLWPTEGPDDE